MKNNPLTINYNYYEQRQFPNQEIFQSDTSSYFSSNQKNQINIQIDISSQEKLPNQSGSLFTQSPQNDLQKQKRIEKREKAKSRVSKKNGKLNIPIERPIEKLDLKVRNRMSAQKSRDKAKEALQNLEIELNDLKQKNIDLKKQLEEQKCARCNQLLLMNNNNNQINSEQQNYIQQNQQQQLYIPHFMEQDNNFVPFQLQHQHKQDYVSTSAEEGQKNSNTEESFQNFQYENEQQEFQREDQQQNTNHFDEIQYQFFQREQSSNSFNLGNIFPKNTFLFVIVIFALLLIAVPVLENQKEFQANQLLVNFHQTGDLNDQPCHIKFFNEQEIIDCMQKKLEQQYRIDEQNNLLSNIQQQQIGSSLSNQLVSLSDSKNNFSKFQNSIITKELLQERQHQSIFCPYSLKFDPFSENQDLDDESSENPNDKIKLYLNGNGLKQYMIKEGKYQQQIEKNNDKIYEFSCSITGFKEVNTFCQQPKEE